MLGPIRAVTTTAADPDAVAAAYERYLGYRVVERGVVAAETAAGWGAPAVAGRAFVALIPESGEKTYLRFVQQDETPGFRALTSFGWNATEIVVQDTDELLSRLKDSPFRIDFPPRPLDGLPDIRAMQGTGPAGEMLYLTWIQRPVAGFDLPVARSFVDRCFIAVLGGPDMAAMQRFYHEAFGKAPGPIAHPRIQVLAQAHGLSQETTFPLATAALGGGSLIEIDEYPTSATARPRPPGGLPAGMAIVTFEHSDLDSLADRLIAAPVESLLPPFGRSATLVGAAGELIELVEV